MTRRVEHKSDKYPSSSGGPTSRVTFSTKEEFTFNVSGPRTPTMGRDTGVPLIVPCDM